MTTRRKFCASVCAVLIVSCIKAVAAQTVVLTAPAATTLPSITPAITVRASGFGAARPFRIAVQVALQADFSGALVLDSTFASSDTLVAVQITRPLPNDAIVYLRAIVEPPLGPAVTSAVIGPKRVPLWLSLITPNSPTGDIFDTRRPLFVWRSAAVSPLVGTWTYELEITSQGRTEVAASGLRDTTFRPTVDLQANTSYRWNVRATLGALATVKVINQGSFLIIDPPLPVSTIFYQNFPNPFPSAVSFATCFWFDIGDQVGQGGRVSIDVLDIRGNFIRSVLSPNDATLIFAPGRYGRGAPGAGSNCDNRFVWDGTGADGRTVAPGVYLIRFKAGNSAPIFRKAFFRP